jgi:EAL domain-containing protein (putative c-di-GMP-specific phosphodiesterase class I)
MDIGHSLDLDVVAEGIERPEQLSRLIELGCGFGQGFHIARPMALEDVTIRLAAERADLIDGR